MDQLGQPLSPVLEAASSSRWTLDESSTPRSQATPRADAQPSSANQPAVLPLAAPASASAARSRRFSSASGSTAHSRVLDDLLSLKEQSESRRAGPVVQQPLAMWRPARPPESNCSADARAIQRAWRRRKLARELYSCENAGALLSSLTLVEERASTRAEAASLPPVAEAEEGAGSPDEWRTSAPTNLASPEGPPKPDIALAKAAVRRQLPQLPDGRLWPLHSELGAFDRFGTDVSQYMHFVYHLARTCAWLFLLNLSNVIINFEGNSEIVSPFTIHTLGNTNNAVLDRGGHSYAVMEICNAAILLAFLFQVRSQLEEMSDRIRHGGHALTAADFTVMVSNVPRHWRSEQLRAHFEKFGAVVHVGVSLDYRELTLAMQESQRLKDKHIDATLHLVALIRGGAPKGSVGKARAAAKRALDALEANRTRTGALTKKRYHCTGYAFVTFNEAAVAKRVLETMPQDRAFSRVFGGGLVVSRAPEPEDIIWENLQTSPREQFARQSLSVLVLTVLLVLSVLLLTSVNLFMQGANPVMEVLGLEEKLEDPTLFEFVLVQALQGLLTLIGYLSIFISVPVMAYFLERPHTRGAREASVMLKLSFFQCAVILVTLFVLTTVETNENDDPDGSFKRGWYPVGMTVLLGALLGDILFIQFGMDLVRPFDLVKKKCFAKRAKTQARMNELYACSADGMLAFRLQILVKVLVLGLFFSFAMPMLYLVIAIYGWIAQWIDRLLLLRLLLPPPPTHEQLMVYIVRVILPLAVVGHSVFALIFFRDLCDDETLDLNFYAVRAQASERGGLEAAGCVLFLPNQTADASLAGSGDFIYGCSGLKACNDRTWSSARVVLLFTACCTALVVLYYLYTSRSKARQERSRRRSDGGGEGRASLVSARQFKRMYRILAQRDLRSRSVDELSKSGALSARVRPETSLSAKSLVALPRDGEPASPAPPAPPAGSEGSVGSGGADEAARQVCISIDSPIDEANASPGPSRPATPVLLALPTTSESAPTEPSEGERLTSGTQLSSQLLLDEQTLMYLPPLTRLLLDSFRKDMTNRGVDAFLRRNGAPALPDGLSPPAAKASLRHWGSCGRRASASEPGGWPAHISLSALRKIPASCGVAMPSSSKPASLLLQLDAIERVLGRRAAPAAEAGGDGDAPR
mmetsp:Transcript_12631/g.37072  ORF Transcript_12631/g.37072 Transcript_12631/m.37072 type:complete len:1152 (+) Transcript_12631:76-3531(+)